ncbi:unnamed protein product, partial [Prorocentrum cordatum]
RTGSTRCAARAGRRCARRGAACARSGPPHAAIPRAARRERPCLQRGEGLRPKSRARACARHGGEVGQGSGNTTTIETTTHSSSPCCFIPAIALERAATELALLQIDCPRHSARCDAAR